VTQATRNRYRLRFAKLSEVVARSERSLATVRMTLLGLSSLPSNSLSRCRERVRVRDICVARSSDAPHILSREELGKVPHPPLEDERRPLPTQGEAIRKERL
jgi:hypothetical protein